MFKSPLIVEKKSFSINFFGIPTGSGNERLSKDDHSVIILIPSPLYHENGW